MLSRTLKACIGALALCAVAAPASAQDVQNFKPALGTWNYLSVEGGRVGNHLDLVPSLIVNYGYQPLVIRDADDEIDQSIIEHLVTADAMLSLSLWDRLDLGVGLPIHYATGDVLEDRESDGFGMGDLRLLPKLRLAGPQSGNGLAVAISVPITLPTGDSDKFVSADGVVANPKLILEGHTSVIRFAVNGGVRFQPKRGEDSLQIGNSVTYGAGVGIPLGTPDVELLGEVYGATPIEDLKDDARSNPLEGLLGLRIFTNAGAVFTLGVGSGIVADYGSPTVRVLGGLTWHRRTNDRDGDGILDADDKCPDDPEDKDGWEDADGCPDPDNDQDGILDVSDTCPDEPEDKDGWEDQDGCPDPDNDGDGILDTADQCPNEKETFNNWEDADGCPDGVPDTDGDGLVDSVDKCPQDPEDKDGFQDDDGCPDPDNDQDGIPDVKDECPNKKETINGFKDEDGCPDKGPSKVQITRDRILILEKVYFKTAKADIQDRSFNLLNQVALTLKSAPFIKKVRIEGHTDSRGNDSYNMRLSQERAESVLNYLIAQGVEASRLEAQGFGETQPIDSNRTKTGRANNRRVEFVITDQELQDEVIVPGSTDK